MGWEGTLQLSSLKLGLTQAFSSLSVSPKGPECCTGEEGEAGGKHGILIPRKPSLSTCSLCLMSLLLPRVPVLPKAMGTQLDRVDPGHTG